MRIIIEQSDKQKLQNIGKKSVVVGSILLGGLLELGKHTLTCGTVVTKQIINEIRK